MQCKHNEARIMSLRMLDQELSECTNCAMNPNMVNNYEPMLKKIDLSRMPGSGVDMEFSDRLTKGFEIGKLCSTIPLVDEYKVIWDHCRIRENHWHNWMGGECPLPEGLIVSTLRRDNTCIKGTVYHRGNWHRGNWHRGMISDKDIIAFKVEGVLEGWTY